MAKLSNPLAFTPGPVTFFTTIRYAALIIAVIIIHNTVPTAPRSPTPVHGINLTEAWQDLQLLTSSYHPYNSHSNDRVREWLLTRINGILKGNNATTNQDIATSADTSTTTTTTTASGIYI